MSNRPHYYQRVNRQHIHGAACSESDHQEAFIDWVNDTEALQTDPRIREALHWLHHVGNGKWRGERVKGRGGVSLPPVAAFRLKMMGVRPGVFDLRLDYRSFRVMGGETGPAKTLGRVYTGLLIEMKSGRGPLSAEQKRYKAFMEEAGYLCRVHRTWQGAARTVVAYMNLTKIAPVHVEVKRDRVVTFTDPLTLLALENIND